jgi:hypothetical protein
LPDGGAYPCRVRVIVALAAFLLLTTFSPAERGRPLGDGEARLAARPVQLDPTSPDRRRVGALTYLAGWALASTDRRFGGISAMHVRDGEVIALSDAGTLLRLPVPERRGRLAVAELPGLGGDKGDRDVEAMAVADGRAWVAFEGSNVVRRYRLPDWTFEAAAAPEAMRDWPGNGGAEAMLRLPDGRFLIFSESAERPDGTSEALLFEGDPAEPGTRAVPLRYRAPAGFNITDAAWLPDGRMLLLHRRFSLIEGVSAVLTVAELPKLSEGAIIEGREIARLRPPVTVDNMEALSAGREGGRTIVWIASDDNFSPLQRTLLMKFALEE